jgi:hypothetical protein
MRPRGGMEYKMLTHVAMYRQALLQKAHSSLTQSHLVLADTATVFTASTSNEICFDSAARSQQRQETDGFPMALAVGIAVMVVAL